MWYHHINRYCTSSADCICGDNTASAIAHLKTKPMRAMTAWSTTWLYEWLCLQRGKTEFVDPANRGSLDISRDHILRKMAKCSGWISSSSTTPRIATHPQRPLPLLPIKSPQEATVSARRKHIVCKAIQKACKANRHGSFGLSSLKRTFLCLRTQDPIIPDYAEMASTAPEHLYCHILSSLLLTH